MEVYDPATSAWSTVLDSLPFRREDLKLRSIQGRLLLYSLDRETPGSCHLALRGALTLERDLGMGLFAGKKGMVLGVANDFSIAWAITQKLLAEGAEVGFTHLPGDKMERRVRKLAEPIGAKLITPCDVQNDDDVARVFDHAKETYGDARLRAPLDRVRADRRLESPLRRRQPPGLQDGHGYQRVTRWRSWPDTPLACSKREVAFSL